MSLPFWEIIYHVWRFFSFLLSLVCFFITGMTCNFVAIFLFIYKSEEETCLPHPLLSRFRHHCGYTNAINSEQDIQKAHTHEVILIIFTGFFVSVINMDWNQVLSCGQRWEYVCWAIIPPQRLTFKPWQCYGSKGNQYWKCCFSFFIWGRRWSVWS